MFRLVVLIGSVQFFGIWYSCKEWTIQQVQQLEQEAHLKGCSWYIEYKNNIN